MCCKLLFVLRVAGLTQELSRATRQVDVFYVSSCFGLSADSFMLARSSLCIFSGPIHRVERRFSLKSFRAVFCRRWPRKSVCRRAASAGTLLPGSRVDWWGLGGWGVGGLGVEGLGVGGSDLS